MSIYHKPEIGGGGMMVEIQWEMRDTATDREWVSCITELDVNTLAQASTWIRKQLPGREHGTVEVDEVVVSAIGDGCPWIGTYKPASDQWNWSANAKPPVSEKLPPG